SDAPGLLAALLDDPEMPKKLKPRVDEIQRSILAYREHQTIRIERTEDLAAVGMSVESASHDILAAGDQALAIARSMLAHVAERMPKNEFMRNQLTNLADLISFVSSRLNDIQGLFVSTRQRRVRRDVGSYAERVGRMFAFALERAEIKYTVSQPSGALIVKSTEAALLQAMMNLVDNAIYWTSLGKAEAREITVQIDANESRAIVADSGPGVDAADMPFIFEPFYSSKGVDGKGLGLYIARQVGARNGFAITLDEDIALLPGANFVITFDDAEAGVN
ncbi:MAG: sensor histidine kinase, partial [Acidimicrobiaceae bacterium]|nr:sensor histidine kinase [Acidimicrobiaceae bacterium]